MAPLSTTDFFRSGFARLGGYADGVDDDDVADGDVDVDDIDSVDVDDVGDVDDVNGDYVDVDDVDDIGGGDSSNLAGSRCRWRKLMLMTVQAPPRSIGINDLLSLIQFLYFAYLQMLSSVTVPDGSAELSTLNVHAGLVKASDEAFYLYCLLWISYRLTSS